MTARDSLACRIDLRRRRLFGNEAWNGLDYLDVADDQKSLCVHFFGGIPEGLGPDNVRISGGRRIRDSRSSTSDSTPPDEDWTTACGSRWIVPETSRPIRSA